MLRRILLGLATVGIIPVVLADATATSNTEIVREKSIEKPNTVSACISQPERSRHCLTTIDVNNLETGSKLWLADIASVLLSGSMFEGCKTRSKQQFDTTVGNSRSSLDKLATSGCIFAWQKPYNHKINKDLDFSVGQQLSSPDRALNSTSLTQSEASSPKFPKLSRTSLIVSLPTENSSFVPKNNKLANPAPETKRIASPFGWRKRPYSYQLQFHQGIDYGAPLGSPVVAVGNGIVTRVVSGCYDFGNLFCGGQLGNWIEIDHGNGRLGVYGHLKNSSIAIEPGMKVWKNQQIAEVGSSGWSTGAHLDFRLKVNGEYEDPFKHLTQPDIAKKL